MIKAIIPIAFMLFISGCALTQSPTGTFAIQYSTMKIIEQNDDVDAQRVLDVTQELRATAEGEESLTFNDLSSTFRKRVDISSLPPSDQLLVEAIISRVQDTINSTQHDSKGFFTRDQTISFLQLLDAIDEAALLYK